MAEEHTAENDAPKYLADEWAAVVDAQTAYLQKLADLQGSCAHPIVLKFTSSEYRTTRACEGCGYRESVQWDSPYKYKDQRLLKRAYDVPWSELFAVHPKVSASDAPEAAARVTPPEVGAS